MGSLCTIKYIQKSISRLQGILGRSLGRTSENYLTMGIDSTGEILNQPLTLTIWYEHPLEIILQSFKP